jgi:hypothetical protein
VTGFVQAVPGADNVPGTAFAHGQGARLGWLVATPRAEVLSYLRNQADARSSLVELSPLTPAPIACNDVKAQAVEARGEGKVVMADVTAYGPEGCPTIRLGAHVSVMDIAEGLCVVAVSKDASRALQGLHAWLDEHATADEAHCALALRVLDREATCWHLSSDAAQVVASYLRCHPKVGELRYPGLKQDPSFTVAARTLQQGFGPRVDYCLVGSGEWRSVVCEAADPQGQVLALEGSLLSLAV